MQVHSKSPVMQGVSACSKLVMVGVHGPFQIECQDEGSRTSHQRKHKPPIMMPTAPIVDLSCFLPIMKRSRTMVHSSVKRLRAMNMGTFRPAVPARQHVTSEAPCTQPQYAEQQLQWQASYSMCTQGFQVEDLND